MDKIVRLRSGRDSDPDRPGYDLDGRWIKSRDFWERLDRAGESVRSRGAPPERAVTLRSRAPSYLVQRLLRRHLGAEVLDAVTFIVGSIIIWGGVVYARAYARAHPNCHHPRYCSRRRR